MTIPNNILVVDDNEMICLLLQETLGEAGHKVDAVHSGEAALAALDAESYQLVLLDLVLPGMRGLEVLKHLRREHPETDAVLITSHGSMETAVEALRLGAKDYLTKPFDDLDSVLNLVEKTLAQRQKVTDKELLYQKLAEKAHHLEAAMRRLSYLNRTSQQLHSILDLQDLFQVSVQLLASEIGSDAVTLWLLDREIGTWTMKAQHGLSLQDGRTAVPVTLASLEEAMQNNLPIVMTADPHLFPGAPPSQFMLCVPLKCGGQVFGAVCASDSGRAGEFTDLDLDLADTLAGQIALATENTRTINRELKETHFQAILALAGALDAKDSTTGEHSGSMLKHIEPLARRLSLKAEETETLRYSAVLHDIGKIGIPERILQKPAELVPEEFEIMKAHIKVGSDILKTLTFMTPVVPVIEAHHEWYNGGGYPKGLAGEKIPLLARIISVLDAFDAMTADRPYRKALSTDEAVERLRQGANTQFDPKVVDAFVEVLAED